MPKATAKTSDKPQGSMLAAAVAAFVLGGVLGSAITFGLVGYDTPMPAQPQPADSPAATQGAADTDHLATASADAPRPDAPRPDTAGEPYIVPAGRSPMPAPDEQITQPIKPQRVGELLDSETPPPDAVVPWDQAHRYLGHELTVEGEIVGTHLLDSGAICFLNFHEDWQDKFYIAVFDEAFAALPEAPDQYYLGKTVRVTGRVTLHKGRPQIEVHRAAQVSVVD